MPNTPILKTRRMERLPPYVFASVNAKKMAARHAGEDIIDLGMGNPDQGTPPHIVDKLVEAARNPRNHRYSASRGIPNLRLAISRWYQRRYGVEIDPELEAIATMGAKEGISHLTLAMVGPGDTVLVPDPTYPIHNYAVIIAGGTVAHVPQQPGQDFFESLLAVYEQHDPKPRTMMLCFPANPTTQVVELDFFERVVAFAQEHKIRVMHDLAYADLCFDGYQAPSFLQVPGAKEVGVEFVSLSKSYNMPGWRVGFCVGNQEMVGTLTRIKSYLDYGMFQPIQIASIIALNECDEEPPKIRALYEQRRDVLCDGLNRIGWALEPPKATMFVWAPIPEQYAEMGSVAFSEMLIDRCKVAVAPGLGFGRGGDGFVRFALVENEHRTRQAIHGLRKIF
jgi:alanine-synthesizing transaminase